MSAATLEKRPKLFGLVCNCDRRSVAPCPLHGPAARSYAEPSEEAEYEYRRTYQRCGGGRRKLAHQSNY